MTKELILMQALLEEKALEKNCAEPGSYYYENREQVMTLGLEISNGKKYFYTGGWGSGSMTGEQVLIHMLKHPEQWEVVGEQSGVESDWIPVEQALPAEQEEVLVWIEHCNVPCQAYMKYSSNINKPKWYGSLEVTDNMIGVDVIDRELAHAKVTHWMTLPKKPNH